VSAHRPVNPWCLDGLGSVQGPLVAGEVVEALEEQVAARGPHCHRLAPMCILQKIAMGESRCQSRMTAPPSYRWPAAASGACAAPAAGSGGSAGTRQPSCRQQMPQLMQRAQVHLSTPFQRAVEPSFPHPTGLSE
jgi:hypothetical protein